MEVLIPQQEILWSKVKSICKINISIETITDELTPMMIVCITSSKIKGKYVGKINLAGFIGDLNRIKKGIIREYIIAAKLDKLFGEIKIDEYE